LTDEAAARIQQKGQEFAVQEQPQQLREAPSAEHNREKKRFWN
jgi:hypothetical protein